MNKYLLNISRKNIVLAAAAVATTLCYMQCSPKVTPTTASGATPTAAATPNTTPQLDQSKGLKDYFKDYFLVGVAVGSRSIQQDSALMIREFNSVTAENDMKMGVIHPTEDTYNWKNADNIVAFAERHKMKIRGHNLLWHTQAAEWMFVGPDGKPASKELLLKRLKDHIFAVAGRYKGKIYAWDVVNEAIDDTQDSTIVYRTGTTKTQKPSQFWGIFQSPEFIDAAFRFAHEADPKAKLYYNDYSSERPAKREKIFKVVKRLKDNGVPIDGVGFQGHWTLNIPTASQLRTALDQIISLGLDVQFTEVDVDVRVPQRPSGPPANGAAPTATRPAATTPDVDAGYTPEIEARQVAQYKMIFDILKEYKKHISSVTFWNVSDRASWLDGRGTGGAAASQTGPRTIRKAYPLLFDVNGQRKKAYWAVVNK
ncbi:endo-1,4-beta-xylanase [Mucilaginibacter calamicampi]|uniref:Beta-xylanase n=1 Tax=Mucilaginibacter calamicampi TaxID=1302352 RepID=A0ABW2YV14_9SPHI